MLGSVLGNAHIPRIPAGLGRQPASRILAHLQLASKTPSIWRDLEVSFAPPCAGTTDPCGGGLTRVRSPRSEGAGPRVTRSSFGSATRAPRGGWRGAAGPGCRRRRSGCCACRFSRPAGPPRPSWSPAAPAGIVDARGAAAGPGEPRRRATPGPRRAVTISPIRAFLSPSKPSHIPHDAADQVPRPLAATLCTFADEQHSAAFPASAIEPQVRPMRLSGTTRGVSPPRPTPEPAPKHRILPGGVHRAPTASVEEFRDRKWAAPAHRVLENEGVQAHCAARRSDVRTRRANPRPNRLDIGLSTRPRSKASASCSPKRVAVPRPKISKLKALLYGCSTVCPGQREL